MSWDTVHNIAAECSDILHFLNTVFIIGCLDVQTRNGQTTALATVSKIYRTIHIKISRFL